MEQQGYQDLLNVLGLLPVITIDVDTQVIDDRNQTKITAHSIVAVRCTLTRDCFKNVHFPQDTKFYGNGMTTYVNRGLEVKCSLKQNWKRRELLESKPKTSFEVHCPYFPELRQEGWWIYLVETKTQILKSAVEKVSGLKDTETVELKFTAPDQGNYTYTIHVRSDSYVGVDVSKEIQLAVAKAEIIENSKQWEFSDEKEIEDEEKLGEDEEKLSEDEEKLSEDEEKEESGEEQQEWTSLSEDDGGNSDASSDA